MLDTQKGIEVHKYSAVMVHDRPTRRSADPRTVALVLGIDVGSF